MGEVESKVELLVKILDVLSTCNEGFWILCLAEQLLVRRSERVRGWKLVAIGVLGYVILIIGMNQIALVSSNTVLIAILYMLVFISVFWKCDVLMTLALVNSYYMLLVIVALVQLVFMGWLGGGQLIASVTKTETVFRAILMLIYIPVWFVLNLISVRFLKRRKWKLGKHYMVVVSLIGLAGGIYLANQFLEVFHIETIFLTYVFLALFVAASYGSYCVFKYRELQQEQKMNIEQANYMEARYEEVNQYYMSNRKLLHDEKNHFRAIYNIAQRNHDEGVMEYVEGLLNGLQQKKMETWTGIDIVDGILNDHMALARERGINFKLKTQMIPRELQLKNWELCSLFCNLLNNCMEAKPQNAELHIYMQGQMLCIQSENDYQREPRKVAGTYRSSKRKYTESGWGLRSIEDIAKKYKGFAEYKDEDGIFSVLVTLEVLKG